MIGVVKGKEGVIRVGKSKGCESVSRGHAEAMHERDSLLEVSK